MQGLSTSNGYAHPCTTLPSTTLTDQFQDLTAKHEALEQQHNTLKLQSIEYKEHISELEHQTTELKQEMAIYEQKMTEEENLKPIVEQHISSMQSSLLSTNEEMVRLQDKNKELIQLTESLQSENDDLTKYSTKLMMTVENNNKQKRISTQINNNTISHNIKLQNEIQLLRDELNILKSLKLNPNANYNSVNSCESPASIASAKTNHTIRINFNHTPDLKDEYVSFGNICDTPTHRTSVSTDTIPYQGFDFVSSPCGSAISVISADVNELKITLEKLETENAQLLLKMDDWEKEKEEHEQEEMEALFRKCDKAIKRRKQKQKKAYRKTTTKFQFSRSLFGL